jgi:lysophospholipase L1-like esterase
MASDGFHPGEPVYRACGEAIARYIADHIDPLGARK